VFAETLDVEAKGAVPTGPFKLYVLDAWLNCKWRYSTRSSQFGRTRHSNPAPAAQPSGVAEYEALLIASTPDVLGHLAPLQVSVTDAVSRAQANPPLPNRERNRSRGRALRARWCLRLMGSR
jgi:hypothetical protein